MHRYLLGALALTVTAATTDAGPFRRNAQPTYYQPAYSTPTYSQPSYYQPTYSPPAYQTPTYLPTAGYATDGAPVITDSGVYTSGYTPTATPGVVTVGGEYTAGYTPVATAGYPTAGFAQGGFGAGDGLDEVNAKRAARGLRPYLRDPGLTQAAMACAQYRATYGIFGHTSNDFAFGGGAASTGCAAYPPSYGWMSCCTYDNYTYAGAAYVTGRDGRRYMHLFVR
jgi:hypothetical protein